MQPNATTTFKTSVRLGIKFIFCYAFCHCIVTLQDASCTTCHCVLHSGPEFRWEYLLLHGAIHFRLLTWDCIAPWNDGHPVLALRDPLNLELTLGVSPADLVAALYDAWVFGGMMQFDECVGDRLMTVVGDRSADSYSLLGEIGLAGSFSRRQ